MVLKKNISCEEINYNIIKPPPFFYVVSGIVVTRDI
jgi:hypothetical protein